MMIVRVRAPFAAFRPFTAGAFRSTAPFVTPSAAYGLLMNLAGIETRLDDGSAFATLVRSDLPQVEMALGAVTRPEVQTIFQQLHNYPVGSTGENHAEDCFGGKYNIQPVRREFLSGIDVCIAVRADAEVEGAVRSAVRGEPGSGPRYGVPFLGDNAFLVDRLDELESAPRRFVIEENARHREEIVAFAVVHRNVVAEGLRYAVRTSRVEGSRLDLRNLPHLAEHL